MFCVNCGRSFEDHTDPLRCGAMSACGVQEHHSPEAIADSLVKLISEMDKGELYELIKLIEFIEDNHEAFQETTKSLLAIRTLFLTKIKK